MIFEKTLRSSVFVHPHDRLRDRNDGTRTRGLLRDRHSNQLNYVPSLFYYLCRKPTYLLVFLRFNRFACVACSNRRVPHTVDFGTLPESQIACAKRRVFSTTGGGRNRGFWHTGDWRLQTSRKATYGQLLLANFCRHVRNLCYVLVEQDQVVLKLDLARFLGRECEIVSLTRCDRE